MMFIIVIWAALSIANKLAEMKIKSMRQEREKIMLEQIGKIVKRIEQEVRGAKTDKV